ncbi:hypothetical protein ACX376_23610 (plasmid) [Sphingobium ummariense]
MIYPFRRLNEVLRFAADVQGREQQGFRRRLASGVANPSTMTSICISITSSPAGSAGRLLNLRLMHIYCHQQLHAREKYAQDREAVRLSRVP